jgi:murein DD-endopeptidase MepM/ murein hydrolase activator NlpD
MILKNLRFLVVFGLVFLSFKAAWSMSLTENECPERTLKLNKNTAKQGEFWDARVLGTKSKPKVWFQSKEFEMFEIKTDETGCKEYRALIPIENMSKPGSYAILAREGAWEEKLTVFVKDNEKGIQKIWLDPNKKSLSPTEKELREIGTAFRTKSPKQLWQGAFIYPSDAPKSSPFGIRRSYNNGPTDSYHKGLDFAAGMGAPVLAPADGEVILTGLESDAYQVHGDTIIIDHGQGLTSIYMHLSKILVKKGDLVKKSQKIGEVGHTGISTGPHLHWGTYLYGISVDPELFLN